MKELQAAVRSSLTEREHQALADAVLRKARASPVTRARVTPPVCAETPKRIARIKQTAAGGE